MVAPKEASTCRSKGPKGEWIERIYDYVIASGSLKEKILQMEVVGDFASRPHKAISLVVKREGNKGMELSRNCRRCCLVTVEGRLQGRSTKETGKEEGEVNEDGGERRIRTHIGQEVVAGIKEKVSVHHGVKEAVQKTSGAKFHAKLGLLTNRK